MSSTPARWTRSRGVSSGLSMFAFDASAVSTPVIARAYGSDAATRSCALAMRLVATSSIALVIFLVERVVRIRRRRARTCPAIGTYRLPLRLRRHVPGDRLDALFALGQCLGLGLVDRRRVVLRGKAALELVDGGVERLDDVVVPVA